jgi:cell division protein FtsQ
VNEKVVPLSRGRKLDLLRYLPSGRSLAIGTAALLLAAGAYGLARATSLFAVAAVEVSGAPGPVVAQVQSELRSYVGRSLLSVDGDAVEQRVAGLPSVRSARVDRAFPHTLRVRVVPEVGVAVLRRGPDAWLVSARGRVIAPVARGSRGRLPRIWLPSSTTIDVGAVLSDQPGALAARSLATFVGSGFTERIAYVSAGDGQLTLGIRGGLEVRLGTPVDLALKIAIARELLPRLALQAAGGPDYLDLSVPERPVAGLEAQPSG